jgi:hypothetical protein
LQLAATGVVWVATLAGCPRGDVTTTGPEVFTAIQGALNKRLEAVHDVSVEGSITDPAGTTLGFRYAMQQPAFSVGELLDPDGKRLRAFAFDGKYLAVVDDGSKTVLRQDLTLNEEQMLLTLHQVFAPFVCEGWRPPLLKAKGTTASRTGDVVTLTVPVGEGGVKQQVVRLKADGTLGQFNDITCTGIEHKMGIKASATCSLSIGDNNDCQGWIIGSEGQGMPIMFNMMNLARIETGMGAMRDIEQGDAPSGGSSPGEAFEETEMILKQVVQSGPVVQ